MILELTAILFSVGVGVGFARVLSELYSIRQWIMHINDKLSRIGNNTAEVSARMMDEGIGESALFRGRR